MSWFGERKRHREAALKGKRSTKKKRIHRKVKEVIDGDTFRTFRRVRGSNTIRVVGIDTPEKGQRGYPSYKRRAKEILLGERVTLIPKATDVYGRVVADVRVHGKDYKKLIKR